MPNALQQAGALSEPSNFAPLHTNRMFTGLWTNRSFLRDAATNEFQEKYGMGRQDSILAGYNSEITPRLTLKRRAGSTVYNANNIAPVKRFYSFNTFTLTDESIRVMADTATDVLDITGEGNTSIWTKASGAGSTYFLSVGNILYFTNGLENKQWNYGTNEVTDWGIQPPANAPTVTQMPRPQPYPSWMANTAFGINVPSRTGMVILDDTSVINTGSFAVLPLPGNGHVAIGCGQNLPPGASISLPSGFDNTRIAVWTTPGTLFGPTELSGVYQSSGAGGFVNSAFQNRSGGNAENVPSNWIAMAWDAQAANDITANTSGGISTFIFRTSNGDDIAIVTGSAPNGTAIPIPPGFSLAEMLSICGMSGCDNTGNAMNQLYECYLKAGVLTSLYADGSGNTWSGPVAIFAVFWKPGQGTSTQATTNGTALVIPSQGSNTATLVFSTSLRNGSSYGLPAGYPSGNIYSTCSVTGGTASGNNNCQGWACSSASQVLSTYYRDGSGNQWDAYASGFTVAFTSVGSTGNFQYFNGNGTTGANAPNWQTAIGAVTQDGSVQWVNLGPWNWQANHNYGNGDMCIGAVPGMANQIFVVTTPGISGALEPIWPGGPNLQQQDNTVVWTCAGHILGWSDIGPDTNISAATSIVDQNGYQQTITREGKTGATPPTWTEEVGATTVDNTLMWTNAGGYSVAATASVQYGYAYEVDSTNNTVDISNMSPASVAITVKQGNQITLQGQGAAAPVTTIPIYRTAQGGSTFLLLDKIPNPGAGQTWTYIDNLPDSALNTEIQAQVLGEGTPLPAGATCLGYHLGRIFAAVGNVVWISSGPDAVVAGSSGNAGFDTTFTAQSKITRFWTCSLGMVVFTVRDAYLILGSATPSDPLYMVVFIEALPLRSYDCFTVNKTTPYLLMGNNMLLSLDPSAGITEAGFPIADRLMDEFDSAASYVTFHNESSLDTALYVANGVDHWYRMAQTNAPESGSSWSPRANFSSLGCVQSVEVTPGQYRLLMSGTSPGPILYRDRTTNADNGVTYPAMTRFGAIVLALPGQLAALSFITLESVKLGTRPTLALLLGELDGTFEVLNRTRQDPTNLPPSNTIFSDRYHFAQNQKTAWCRHFQMEISWVEEDVNNELLTFTVFGQTWQEMKAQ